jgi:uncharacterized protein (DUF1778 family)
MRVIVIASGLEDLRRFPINAFMSACSGMVEQQGALHLITNSTHKYSDALQNPKPACRLAVEVLSNSDAVDDHTRALSARG